MKSEEGAVSLQWVAEEGGGIRKGFLEKVACGPVTGERQHACTDGTRGGLPGQTAHSGHRRVMRAVLFISLQNVPIHTEKGSVSLLLPSPLLLLLLKKALSISCLFTPPIP